MLDLTPFIANPGEKPLDRICPDGGMTAIFRTIACIGDSLSSGEFELHLPGKPVSGHDFYDYSWGQFMARMAGNTVYNFSRGGMTAKEYWKSFAEEKGFWSEDKLCQCYILALGVNDVINQKQEVGTVADALSETESDTFAYYYCQIIKRLKQMQPQARFFLVSMPRSANEAHNAVKEAHCALLEQMAAHFAFTYVIDLTHHCPVYDDAFKKNFYLGNHMNPQGYLLTAKIISSYIDYIIRNHPEDFAKVGFIGREPKNQ